MTAPLRRFRQDPDEYLDYTVDWSRWLSGDAVNSAIWLVSPAGVTATTPTFTNSAATVWLAGGTVGVIYTITNRITTALGRNADRSFTVRIEQR